MINRNNLNRIKGILKAQLGIEIPTYTVKEKDTLSKIIAAYNIANNTNLNVNDVATWNNITNPNLIQIGQILNMANPATTTLNGAPVNTTTQLQEKEKEKEKESAGKNEKDQKESSQLNNLANLAFDAFNTIGNTLGTALVATDSKLTLGSDLAYDNIANIAEKFGPKGKIVGTAMKAAGAAGNMIQAMGGGTDQQTNLDKWMDSSFFSWNIGMLNGFAGKKSDSFSIDNSIAERVGGAYGGSLAEFNELTLKANKEYGLFSSAARKKTDKLIAEAKQQLNTMGNIADAATLQRLNAQYAGEQSGLAYQNLMSGGYNLKYTYAAKHGGILDQHIPEQLEWEPLIELNWELPEFQNGGSIELQEELEWIPELQEGGKTRNIDELIEYAKKQNTRFIQRMSEPMKYLDLGNGERGSHLMSWGTDDDGAIVYSQIQEDENGNLKDYGDQAMERAIDNNNILRMSPEEAKLFTESDEDSEGNLFGYKKGWPEVFRENYDFSQESKEYPQEYIDFKNSLPRNQRLTPESKYRTYEYWQSWGKPKNFEEAKKLKDGDTYMYNYDSSDNSYHGSSIAWLDGIGYFTKPKDHDTVKYELDYYNKGLITEEGGKLHKAEGLELKDWEEFTNNYDLVDDGNFYKYIPKNKKFKDGGQLNTSDIPEIEETTQKNVIPEGALHKNKHHMEHAKGLTKKGIPVVDEDGDLQAEIEHSEIIFTLEVTKKLEEYYNIFYSEDASEKEKDQAATNAGKLLVYLILENTDDRTGLIESCKKGGQLTHNSITKSEITKNLMKEAIKEALFELLIK